MTLIIVLMLSSGEEGAARRPSLVGTCGDRLGLLFLVALPALVALTEDASEGGWVSHLLGGGVLITYWFSWLFSLRYFW